MGFIWCRSLRRADAAALEAIQVILKQVTGDAKE